MKVSIPLPEGLYEFDHLTFTAGGRGAQNLRLTDYAKKLVGMSDAARENTRNPIRDNYKLEIVDGEVCITTSDQSYARGLINRILRWPTYTVTKDGSRSAVEAALKKCEGRYIQTQADGKNYSVLFFVHFEDKLDAATFRLACDGGITNAYATKLPALPDTAKEAAKA